MKNVVLAMSGGIDSSVALYLLKKQGYNVRGVTMQNGSMSEKEIEDARIVAQQNGVEWELIDIETEFKSEVERYFVESYEAGMTPNPCAICNKKIKFGLLFDLMKAKYGDIYYATGHYAKILYDDNSYYFTQANDTKKDQSYFLSTVKKEYLSHIIFPLAELSKEEVRKIGEENHIKTSGKPDSQEICFVSDDDYRRYLLDHGTKPKSGDFIFADGTILGSHQGTFNYTVGQRKGLGISYSEKLFVKELNTKTNEVILDIYDHMFNKGLEADKLNLYIGKEKIVELSEKLLQCKVRSNAKPINVNIRMNEGKLEVIFQKKQFAISPGQLCVIYDEGKVILSGRIINVFKDDGKE